MENTKREIEVHQKKCDEQRERMKEFGIEGPWMTEPDRVEFKHAGLDCLLVRQAEMFQWCGYVGVGPKHSSFGKDYDDVNADVHGGLTYGEKCRGAICHITENEDNLHWFGFDCAHCYDLMPGTEVHRKTILGWPEREAIPGFEEHYRDLSFVTEQTRSLAEQLARMVK